MLQDPLFYALAVPALLVTGISKGGFGSGLGIVAVPMLSLAIPPLQAAGIMLPILCLMDVFGVWRYRRRWDRANMRIMIPGALAGITLGALTAGLVDENAVRLIIGLIAVLFALDHWVRQRAARQPARLSVAKGGFWSAVSGFTSFVGHAGGPPLSVYLLPQRLDMTLMVGTTVIFFAVVNYAKLVPYALLGQLDTTNLATAAVLSPLAPLGMWLGIWLHGRISQQLFYRVCYGLVFVVGLRLLWVGVGL